MINIYKSIFANKLIQSLLLFLLFTANIPKLYAIDYTFSNNYLLSNNGIKSKQGYSTVQLSNLNATVSSANVSGCNGNSNGSIFISGPTGGSGSYEYSIDGSIWTMNNNFMGLKAGIYSISIRDMNNVADALVLNSALKITEPAMLSAFANTTNVTGCNGNANGVISFSSMNGGSGMYQYTINGGINWFNATTFNNLSVGIYNVKMRDATNPSCVITINSALIITQPVELSASASTINVRDCFGNSNGVITISNASGGSGTYQYAKDGGMWVGTGTTHDFQSLAAGTYTISIRDAIESCTIQKTLFISQPVKLSASISTRNVSCGSVSNGEINILSPIGGSGSYEYSNNGGIMWQGTSNFSNLKAGSYTVLMRDALSPSCIFTINSIEIISESTLISANVKSTNGDCTNGNRGKIEISNPTGGSGTYKYAIEPGTSWTTASIFADLIPGAYKVTMQDQANPSCIEVLNSNLQIRSSSILSATIITTHVNGCSNDANGTIKVSNPSGGSGEYSFSFNKGITWQTEPSLNSLVKGYYDVSIRNSENLNCVTSLSTVFVNAPSPLQAKTNNTVGSCENLNNGRTRLEVYGGTGSYTYSPNLSTSLPEITGLAPGTYTVVITDSLNCSVTHNFVIEKIACSPIHIGAITSAFCNDSIYKIPFTLQQGFTSENWVKFQLSDATGSFAAPYSLDSFKTNVSGSEYIKFRNIPEGDNYRIRAICTSPYAVGPDNGQNIKIASFLNTAPVVAGQMDICEGTSANIKAYAISATAYRWFDASEKEITSNNGAQFSHSFVESQKTLYVIAQNHCNNSFRTYFTLKKVGNKVLPILSVNGIKINVNSANNYQWYFNHELLSGEELQNITALKTGFYKVKLNNDICPTEDSIYFSGITLNVASSTFTVPVITKALYQWFYENSLLEGESASTFNPTRSGKYKVVITFDNSNLRTSAMTQAVYEFNYNNPITGIEASESNFTYSVFNNTEANLIEIVSATSLQNCTINIYSTNGTLVYSNYESSVSKSHTVDLSKENAGLYNIVLTKNNKQYQTKIVKY